MNLETVTIADEDSPDEHEDQQQRQEEGEMTVWEQQRRKVNLLLDECAMIRFPFKKKLRLINLQLSGLHVSTIVDTLKNDLGRSLHLLSLSSNPIYDVPPQLVSSNWLPKLQTLDLSCCELEYLPSCWSLQQLKRLNLSHNRLTDFPSEGILKGLPVLKKLNMYANKISTFTVPVFPGALENLEELNLGYNDLAHLPDDLDRLQALRSLKVVNNFLEEIPMRVCNMNLKSIDVSSNPVMQPPIETCERGIASMRKFYRCLQQEEQFKTQRNTLFTFEQPTQEIKATIKKVETFNDQAKTNNSLDVELTVSMAEQQNVDPESPECQTWLSKITLFDCSQLKDAPEAFRANREFMLEAVEVNARALEYASEGLRSDRAFIMELCRRDGEALEFASEELRANKEIVLEACKEDRRALAFASRSSKKMILEVCKQDGLALEYAATEFQADRQIVRAACKADGRALRFASIFLQDDKDIAFEACKQNGFALQYASDRLRADKDIVIAAVKFDPDMLKYAMGGLNQDPDCLVAAGLWDETYQSSAMDGAGKDLRKKIVLSTRFSLKEDSNSRATEFAVLLKQHPFIRSGNFSVYSPNAFGKSTCDPSWTNFEWSCRGTYKTCQKEHNLKVGIPRKDSCWRYSFRYQLEDAKRSNGFMIQVVEGAEPFSGGNSDQQILCQELGDGQKIEREMAQHVPTKVFRVHRPVVMQKELDFRKDAIAVVVSRIQQWYDEGCKDMSECTMKFGLDGLIR